MRYQELEFNYLNRIITNNLFNHYITDNLEDLAIRQITNLILKLNPTDTLNMINDYNYINSVRNTELQSINTYASNNYFRLLTELWNAAFKVGIKHSVVDSLSQLPTFAGINFKSLFSNVKKKSTSFTNFGGITNTDLAEFILSEAQKKAKEKAEIDRAKKVTAMLDIKQKKVYIDSTRKIYSNIRQAEITRKDFLGSEYMRTRLRVLSRDYANSNDRSIRVSISKYLKENNTSIQNLRDTQVDVNNLRKKIQEDLRKKGLFKTKGKPGQAFKIARTELNLAYNFGKLSGFTGSEEDLNRKVMWAADWEMQNKVPGYRVCDFCKNMNGKVYTVSKIIQLGVILDRGILNYKGTSSTKTSFKNPNIPMIPGHPECSCYWVVLPPDSDAKVEADASNLTEVLKTGMLALGTVSILVGAGFLASRSGLFKQFIKSSVSTVPESVEVLTSPTTLNTLQDLANTNAPRPAMHPLLENYLNSPAEVVEPFLLKKRASKFKDLMNPTYKEPEASIEEVTETITKVFKNNPLTELNELLPEIPTVLPDETAIKEIATKVDETIIEGIKTLSENI